MRAFHIKTAIFLALVILAVIILVNYVHSDLSEKPESIADPQSVKVIKVKTTKAYATPYHENSYPFTDLRESEKLTLEPFWRSHKASYQCPPELLARVGKSGEEDGGKWMCGLDTLARRNLEDGYNCTFYSFGVAGDSSYEAEVLHTTHCSVFAYDPTDDKIGPPLKTTNPRVHFFKTGISGKNGKGKHKKTVFETKTLKTMMTENGHSFIDILKVDVEGFEYESLERMLDDFEELPFGQLLLEMHLYHWKPETVKRVLDLIRNLEKRGARLFSVEPNELHVKYCSEFSFINLKYRALFIPEESLE